MPECTTCGNHVTHEYVRVFGDNENSIDSCRNCRSSTPKRDSTDEEGERVVYLEDVLEDEHPTDGTDQESTASDERDTSGPKRRDTPIQSTAESGNGVTEEQSGGRFGLGRLRSLFGQ